MRSRAREKLARGRQPAAASASGTSRCEYVQVRARGWRRRNRRGARGLGPDLARRMPGPRRRHSGRGHDSPPRSPPRQPGRRPAAAGDHQTRSASTDLAGDTSSAAGRRAIENQYIQSLKVPLVQRLANMDLKLVQVYFFGTRSCLISCVLTYGCRPFLFLIRRVTRSGTPGRAAVGRARGLCSLQTAEVDASGRYEARVHASARLRSDVQQVVGMEAF